MQKTINSPNFYNIDSLVKKYRVNKYEILEAIGGENAGEGVIMSIQTDRLLKRLKELAQDCKAVDCDKCSLDKIMCGDYTLCEILTDATVDSKGRLELKRVQQMFNKCSTNDLKGEVIHKGYRIYKGAVDEMSKYIQSHSGEKVQDIVSLALLEYVERRK
jgi:hypothetical protein